MPEHSTGQQLRTYIEQYTEHVRNEALAQDPAARQEYCNKACRAAQTVANYASNDLGQLQAWTTMAEYWSTGGKWRERP